MTISQRNNVRNVFSTIGGYNVEKQIDTGTGKEGVQNGKSAAKQQGLKANEGDVEECDDCMKHVISAYASKMSISRRLPFTKWVPMYSSGYLVRDFIAGITVGLTAIPQGIAYASVAGLEPQYGLYSTIMPCFLYIIFGGCKDITLGPTAIMSLMTFPYAHLYGPASAVLLCFLSGIIISLLSIFQLGFLVDFISVPVTTGFTAAAAFTILSAQIKNFLGLKIDSQKATESWVLAIKNLDKIRWPDATLGCSTILILFLARYLKQKSASFRGERRITANVLWLIGLSGNAIVIICGSALAYSLSTNNVSPFILTGAVSGGLPPFEIPSFTVGNQTFVDTIKDMGSAVIAIPLISIMETIAIGKAFEKGKGVDATQEMIALGVSNIAGAFIGSIPISGSFTRSAINNTSGVKTPLGGLFTGILILMALGFLTDLFYYIPKASLAGLIIMAMIFMVEYHLIGVIWRTKRSDIIPLCTAFFSCLFFTIEVGMVVGIATDLCFILYFNARPTIKLSWLTFNSHKILYVVPKQDLLFPSSAYIREAVIDGCKKRDELRFVVVDGSHIHRIDTTTAKGFASLKEDVMARGQRLILWKWNESAIRMCYNFDEKLGQCFRYDENLRKVLDEVSGTVTEQESMREFSSNGSSNEQLTTISNNV